MRTNSAEFDDFNQSASKDLRLVIVIDYPTPLYLTSHASISGLAEALETLLTVAGRQPTLRQPPDRQALNRQPGEESVSGTLIEGCLQDVSSTSQRLVPDEGRSEIGSLSFSVVDVGGAVSAEIREQLEAGLGLKGRTVQLYRGGADMSWADFRLEQTQRVDGSVEYENGAYRFRCADIQREMRSDIFDLAKTYLAASFTAAETTTLQVFDTSLFTAATHVASFGDQPSGTFYYLKIKYNNGFEIIRATGKTATTFTGLTRGVFGTEVVLHELPAGADADSGIEIEEYVYLELPAPAMAYALLTGNIIGGGTIPWNLGIDPAFVDQPSFEDIGQDWFDSSDYADGLIFRFQGVSKTDGKRFIEREVCLLAGAFLKVGADGKLYMRRMTGIIGTADYVAEITADNAIAHGAITHDLSRLRNTFDVEWSWLDLQTEREPTFVRRNVLVDAASIAIHGQADPLPLQFRGLHAERHTRTTLNNRFDALRDRYAGPPITLKVDLLPSLNDLEVGDIVRAIFPTVRDYSGTDTLDRAFEIQRISVNQLTGRVSAELFGSTRKATPIADAGAGASSELPDGWYNSFGTEMGTLLSIDGSGFLTADGGLTGGTTSRVAFYYLGDFTIPSGRTLTLTGNVQLHIRGHFQVNGTLLGSGGHPPNEAGYLGSTFGGKATTIRGGLIRKIPGPRRNGSHQAVPVIEIENHAGVLAGMPADMRGSGGAVGGNVWEWDGSAMVAQATGGAGGVGGGSVIVVSRGAGYGVAGETDLSGTDGSTGGLYSGERAGSGGGGAPGSILHVLDGSQVTVPVLSGHIVANYGTSPLNGADVNTEGKARAADPVNLGIAAARILYVPKSRDPYLDEFNDALNPDGGVTIHYIKPADGTAIHNGTGTITIEARKVTPAGDILLATGTIKLFDEANNELTVANGYATGSDGYTGVLDAGDISGSAVITLKDGVGGDPLDTITLVDILDGADGTVGADAVYGYIDPENGLAWTYDANAASWSPATLTSDLDVTFVQGGVDVARIARRVTLTSGTGALAVTSTTHKHASGDLNTGRVTVSLSGDGTTAVTVSFAYSFGGENATVAETVKSVLGGTDGVDPITGFLDNESHVVSAAADGTGYSLSGAGGTFNVFDGISSVTGAGPTYSVFGTAVKNGLTMAINGTSGAYSLSGASWTSDGETFVLRAVYGGVTIDKTYTISKSKQGPSAAGIIDMPVSFTSEAIGTLPQTAAITFQTDGVIAIDGYPDTTWWSEAPETGVGSSYEVRCSAILGGAWDVAAAATGTWVAMSTNRTWHVQRTTMEGAGSDVVSCTFQIRASGGGLSVLDEATASAEAADV